MADRYSPPPPPPPPPEHDTISVLLHQFLFRTSSSPSPLIPSPSPHQVQMQSIPISASQPFFPTAGISSDNDPDDYDYDYENQEGFEALMEETTPKQNHPRISSKRSRAAEVHNLSEKRRRSRINEKMKALQNLIPNSNKTDKASMLDEAIEYLKQLQLQVQMLTMRNGLNLYPMCLPDVIRPNQPSEQRISFHEGNGPLNLTASTLPNNPSTLANSLFSLAKQCNNLKLPLATNIITNSKPSYGVASSIQVQHGSSELNICPEKEFCREDMPYQPLNMDHSTTNLGVGVPFELQASGLSENKVWGVSNLGRG